MTEPTFEKAKATEHADDQPSTVPLAPWTGRHTHEVLAALERQGVSVTVEEDPFPGRALLELIRPVPDAEPGDHVVVSVFGGRVVRLRTVSPDDPDQAETDRLSRLEQRVDGLEAKIAELTRRAAKRTREPRSSARKSEDG